MLDQQRCAATDEAVEQWIVTQWRLGEIRCQPLARCQYLLERDRPRRCHRVERDRLRSCRHGCGPISLGTGVATRTVVIANTSAANMSSTEPVSRKCRVPSAA